MLFYKDAARITDLIYHIHLPFECLHEECLNGTTTKKRKEERDV